MRAGGRGSFKVTIGQEVWGGIRGMEGLGCFGCGAFRGGNGEVCGIREGRLDGKLRHRGPGVSWGRLLGNGGPGGWRAWILI